MTFEGGEEERGLAVAVSHLQICVVRHQCLHCGCMSTLYRPEERRVAMAVFGHHGSSADKERSSGVSMAAVRADQQGRPAALLRGLDVCLGLDQELGSVPMALSCGCDEGRVATRIACLREGRSEKEGFRAVRMDRESVASI